MKHIRRPVFLGLLATVVAVIAAACSSSASSAAKSPSPTSTGTGMVQAAPGWKSLSASDFVTTVDNPWFPLIKGYTWVSKGLKDGKPIVDTFTVTGQTRVIEGVTCTVVSDVTTQQGHPVEKTRDWYAQDKQGNVWYMGENTAELNIAGKVTSTEGTWQSGVNGAKPGLFMPAQPTVGVGGYQEYLKGQAVDQYRITRMNGSVTVPYRSFSSCMVAKETTALEPRIVDRKYYVKGIGQVAEETVSGSEETSFLVSFTK